MASWARAAGSGSSSVPFSSSSHNQAIFKCSLRSTIQPREATEPPLIAHVLGFGKAAGLDSGLSQPDCSSDRPLVTELHYSLADLDELSR